MRFDDPEFKQALLQLMRDSRLFRDADETYTYTASDHTEAWTTETLSPGLALPSPEGTNHEDDTSPRRTVTIQINDEAPVEAQIGESGSVTLCRTFHNGDTIRLTLEDFAYFVPQPDPKAPTPEHVKAVFKVLEKWFLAMEDGTAEHWHPDPKWKPPAGWPSVDPDEFIQELDREMDIDAFGWQGREKYKADATCEFHRLEFPQRWALLQEVTDTLEELHG